MTMWKNRLGSFCDFIHL